MHYRFSDEIRSVSPSSFPFRSSYAGHRASPFGLRVAAPREARRAKRGGPGRTRTCNQTVMSDGPTRSFVDFAVFWFSFDRACRVLIRSFLVRNWCGVPWIVIARSNIIWYMDIM